jgi:Na+-driven multidrug efflux pump
MESARKISNLNIATDIYRISIPQLICLIIFMMSSLFNVSIIGHLGSEADLAGAGMASMLMNIMANSLM